MKNTYRKDTTSRRHGGVIAAVLGLVIGCACCIDRCHAKSVIVPDPPSPRSGHVQVMHNLLIADEPEDFAVPSSVIPNFEARSIAGSPLLPLPKRDIEYDRNHAKWDVDEGTYTNLVVPKATPVVSAWKQTSYYARHYFFPAVAWLVTTCVQVAMISAIVFAIRQSRRNHNLLQELVDSQKPNQ